MERKRKMMKEQMDDLDRKMIALLKVNARLPLARLAKALGIARSTAQLRLKALEDQAIITGYTLSLGRLVDSNRICAMVLIALAPQSEASVITALRKRHEITRLQTVSGRYDLCVHLQAETTHELDALIDRIRILDGVAETFSTIFLSTKIDRPE